MQTTSCIGWIKFTVYGNLGNPHEINNESCINFWLIQWYPAKHRSVLNPESDFR